jgi:hypothetical protein
VRDHPFSLGLHGCMPYAAQEPEGYRSLLALKKDFGPLNGGDGGGATSLRSIYILQLLLLRAVNVMGSQCKPSFHAVNVCTQAHGSQTLTAVLHVLCCMYCALHVLCCAVLCCGGRLAPFWRILHRRSD